MAKNKFKIGQTVIANAKNLAVHNRVCKIVSIDNDIRPCWPYKVEDSYGIEANLAESELTLVKAKPKYRILKGYDILRYTDQCYDPDTRGWWNVGSPQKGLIGLLPGRRVSELFGRFRRKIK
jgi:hypothetical protein